MKLIDLAGKTFGYLHVTKETERRKRLVYWKCKCICGKEKWIASIHLRKGHTRSCGCKTMELFKAAVGTHKKSSHWLYRRWKDLRNRCFNKNVKSYVNYGKRGITVAPEWKDDFQAFYDYIVSTIGLDRERSLDRIDVNKGYEPGNLRWATQSQQMWNTRAVKNKYKGTMLEESGKYRAQIACKGIIYYLGVYATQEEAARAYNEKAKELHGEFAHLNEIK